VNADAKLNALLGRHARVAFDHRGLDFESNAIGLRGAWIRLRFAELRLMLIGRRRRQIRPSAMLSA
jgi:hypothetical protein